MFAELAKSFLPPLTKSGARSGKVSVTGDHVYPSCLGSGLDVLQFNLPMLSWSSRRAFMHPVGLMREELQQKIRDYKCKFAGKTQVWHLRHMYARGVDSLPT